MFYYQEITLIEQAEISVYFIWSKLYTQLHLALVEVKDQNDKVNIGISFPEYRFSEEKGMWFLGTKLRLIANSDEVLHNLKIKNWLSRLSDYVDITSIREVPAHKITGYVSFSRKQVKTNAERLARYRVKSGDIDFAEAVLRYQNIVTRTDLPFIQLNSLNNKHPFRLFIEKQEKEQSPGFLFSTYGLSPLCAVPEFIT